MVGAIDIERKQMVCIPSCATHLLQLFNSQQRRSGATNKKKHNRNRRDVSAAAGSDALLQLLVGARWIAPGFMQIYDPGLSFLLRGIFVRDSDFR